VFNTLADRKAHEKSFSRSLGTASPRKAGEAKLERYQMKKHLLGTTALVAAGMFAMTDTAAAQTKVGPVQVSVGGYYAEYVSYTDQDDRGGAAFNQKLTEFDQWSDKELHFNGRTTLDNGLTVGFRVELEANTDASDQIDESFMFLEGRFGRMELGSINNVQYRMGYNAPEAQTRPWSNEGNITNVFLNTTGSPFGDSMLGTTRSRFFDNDSEKINYYTPRFAGFQFGASYIPNSAQDRNGAPDPISAAYSRGYAFGANFVRTFGAFDVAASLGYMAWTGADVAAGPSDDPYQYNAGLQLGFAGFKVGGSYGEIKDGRSGASGTNAAASTAGTALNKVDGRAWDAGVMYTFGPAAVSLNYIDGRNDDSLVTGPATGEDKFSLLSLAGKYTLGPGVSLEANIWTGKFEGNGTGGAVNTDNEGTGGLVGVVLVF
jgi:predicted porin